MTSGARLPTWNERENNKRRERRRRAVSAKIFAGLRMYGSYQLPKHCDNNEVLKALCAEAGWTVEADGTTYRKGLKPASERKSEINPSASPSPCSSYKPTPSASYNPSPTSSSFPSPHINDAPINSLPWLKNLSSSSSSASSSKNSHPRSISAPITPPLSSPSSRTPRMKTDWDESPSQLPPPPPWAGWTFLPNSTPPSPGRHHQIIPGPDWLAGIQIPTGPTSPTFSLVSSHPFGVFKEAVSAGGSSRMWTPGQSGNCSPVMEGLLLHSEDIQMADEFAFGSSREETTMAGMVKAWEGERIHEEDCGSDELELTLGNSRTRVEGGVL